MNNSINIDLDKYPGITEEILKELTDRAYQEIKNDNYIIITLGYSNRLVFTYTVGLEIVDRLRKAESVKSDYSGDNLEIIPYKGEIEFKILSRNDYAKAKLIALLDEHKQNLEKEEDSE